MITTLEQGVVLHLVPTSTPYSNFLELVPENLHTLTQKGLEIPKGGGVSPFCGGGIDIFWSYTQNSVINMWTAN